MNKQDSDSTPTVLKEGQLPSLVVIPAVPDDAEPMDGAARQALLKIASDQRAEVDQAMEELWSKRAELAQDLGTLTPDTDWGKVLYDRMILAREANRKAQALAAYTEEQEALANHAVMGHLNTAAGDIEHMAQKIPGIAGRYEKVLIVGVQRREAIVAGIARAKATKGEAPKKA